jgi:CO/xanthine dehydrogenase FAD-binding subunit
LRGVPLIAAADRIDPALVAAALSPIDDIRADAAYRTEAATELVRRAMAEATAP